MSIRERGPGRWMVDVQTERADGSMERARKVFRGTRREAEAFERDLRRAILSGDREQKEVPTLAGMWEDFVAYQTSSANKRRNRPRTIVEARRMFAAYLEPALGDVRVDRITAKAIDDLVTALEAGEPAEGVKCRPLKHNSIANVMGLLRRMLHVAKRWEYVDEVPEINAEKQKAERIEDDQWLTEDEVVALVEAAEPEWRSMIITAARTGLRCGELQGLQWGDLDLVAGRLTVKRSWSDHIGKLGPPKSGKPREVPLTWDVVEALGTGRHRQAAYVFGDGERPFQQDELRRALARARKGAAIEKHVHAHMLRHSFASHCIMRGIATRIVMSWGGWKSESMLARYAHLAPRQVGDLIHRIAPKRAGLRALDGGAAPRQHGGNARRAAKKTAP